MKTVKNRNKKKKREEFSAKFCLTKERNFKEFESINNLTSRHIE